MRFLKVNLLALISGWWVRPRMHTTRFFPLLFAAFLTSLVHCSAADRIDGFAKLASADTLQVRFTSGGCFHFYTYILTFTRTNTLVAVERPDRGKLELADMDLAGLDTLLTFYRTNTAGGCTTQDKITISQVRDGTVIATEQLKDDSCRAYGVKGVLTIKSLARRFPEKKDKK
jgi:hypothetical protein